jgi:uncharacterized protein YdbL (DUF1318 family)
MTGRRKSFLTVLFCMALTALTVLSDAKDDAHARRKERWDKVKALLLNGAAVEGANGYLVPASGSGKDQRKVVDAENNDRKIGYEAIARENKTRVEAIARAAGRINRKKADDLKKNK